MAIENRQQTGEITIEAFGAGLLDWPRLDRPQGSQASAARATQTRELSLEAFALGLEGPRPDNTQELWEKVVQTTRAAEIGRITGIDQGLLNQLTIDALVAQMAFLERLRQKFEMLDR